MKILAVDPNEEVLEEIKEILKGHCIETAPTRQKALQMLIMSTYDFLIIDREGEGPIKGYRLVSLIKGDEEVLGDLVTGEYKEATGEPVEVKTYTPVKEEDLPSLARKYQRLPIIIMSTDPPSAIEKGYLDSLDGPVSIITKNTRAPYINPEELTSKIEDRTPWQRPINY